MMPLLKRTISMRDDLAISLLVKLRKDHKTPCSHPSPCRITKDSSPILDQRAISCPLQYHSTCMNKSGLIAPSSPLCGGYELLQTIDSDYFTFDIRSENEAAGAHALMKIHGFLGKLEGSLSPV